MNTNELISEVAKRMGCYKKDVRELLLQHFLQVLLEAISRGEKVHIAHLGTFYPGLSYGRNKEGTRRLWIRFSPAEDLIRKLNSAHDSQGGSNAS
ncbi:MAG: HU family DNA-binding protein [Thermanaeromonas sp.]|uniref:HU family DNA-binding protein n=1 Tax=Neomoorellaceae TaxID=3039168 RepID=UPI002438A431|nr:HU family DNA-binding protein [Thermanaeromonas sp.]MCG0278953.1 HU family DNA-binding protein [Thermanaeromonas sp.]